MRIFFISCFLLAAQIALGQSKEAAVNKAKLNYLNIEDSLLLGKKFKISKVFDASPELWILSYHNGYNFDVREDVQRVPTDASITAYYWNDEIRMLEYEEWDMPDRFKHEMIYFYLLKGKILFVYIEEQKFDRLNRRNTEVVVTEERQYYKDDVLVRLLEKYFVAPDEKQIREISRQEESKKIKGARGADLEFGYKLVKWVRQEGYMNDEEN